MASLRLCFNLCQKKRLQAKHQFLNHVERPKKTRVMAISVRHFFFWTWPFYLMQQAEGNTVVSLEKKQQQHNPPSVSSLSINMKKKNPTSPPTPHHPLSDQGLKLFDKRQKNLQEKERHKSWMKFSGDGEILYTTVLSKDNTVYWYEKSSIPPNPYIMQWGWLKCI